MKGIMLALVGGFCLVGMAEGAELASENRGPDGQPRTFNWQDREYFGTSYVYRTLGGDGTAGESGSSGDAGAATGAGDGDSGGNGDGCGPK